MSPQMGPRPLLGLGSQLSGLLAPASLALTRAPVPPVVATLSVLAARPEFWAIHALSIDYAAGVTGDLEAGITRVLTDRRLGDLAESSDFQTYLGRTDLSYGEIGADPGALAYAGQILDITIVPDRLRLEGAATTAARPPPSTSIAWRAAVTSSASVFCARSRPPTRTKGRHSSASTGIGASARATARSNASRRRGSRAASSALRLTTSTP